jgi:BASS family bile acid:Na+ symporter
MRQTLLEVVQLAVRLVVPLFAFAVGLGAGEARPGWLWRRPGLLLRSLLAVQGVVPVLAVVVVKVLPLGQPLSAGLLVVALSAGPVMAIARSRRGGTDQSYAFNLDVWLLATNLVFVPAAVSVLGAVFQKDLHFGVLDVARVVLPLQLLPLAAGALVGRLWPGFSRRAVRPLSVGATTVLAALGVVLLIGLARPMLALGGLRLLVLAAFSLLAVATGHLLGGPTEGTRRVLATFSGMRFPALALALASLSPVGQEVLPVVLAYLLFTALVLTVYALLGRKLPAPHVPAAGAR